jgi:hypothetical protein
VGVPLIIAIAVFSILKERVPEAPPVAGRATPVAAGSLSTKFGELKQNISDRAAIRLTDDFRTGLSSWTGKGEWSRSWSYDPSGFARIGDLAVYSPSKGLSDYRLEFLGQIERKGMSWVYRARDFDNYYATKLVLTSSAGVPKLSLLRWAVVKGMEQDRVRLPLPLAVQTDTIYRIRVDASGSSFTTWIQGQVVDHWADPRHKSGGIGFFGTKGEASILRWISVTHHFDVLGRLCAFIAPYSLETSKGE